LEELFHSPAPMYPWAENPERRRWEISRLPDTQAFKFDNLAMSPNRWILATTNDSLAYPDLFNKEDILTSNFNWTAAPVGTDASWSSNPMVLTYQLTLAKPRGEADRNVRTESVPKGPQAPQSKPNGEANRNAKDGPRVLAIGSRAGKVPFTLVLDNGDAVAMTNVFRSAVEKHKTTEGLPYCWALKASRPVKLGMRPSTAAFSGGGDFLAIGAGDRLEEWDFTSPDKPVLLQSATLGKSAIIRSVAVSPRGDLFAAGGDLFAAGGVDASVWVFDRASGKRLVSYKAFGIPFRLMFDPDSRYLVAAVGNDRKDVGRTLSVSDEGSKIQVWLLPAPAPAARE
jgi:WD40 repeat protein